MKINYSKNAINAPILNDLKASHLDTYMFLNVIHLLYQSNQNDNRAADNIYIRIALREPFSSLQKLSTKKKPVHP